jgi:hypothetical protein
MKIMKNQIRQLCSSCKATKLLSKLQAVYIYVALNDCSLCQCSLIKESHASHVPMISGSLL